MKKLSYIVAITTSLSVLSHMSASAQANTNSIFSSQPNIQNSQSDTRDQSDDTDDRTNSGHLSAPSTLTAGDGGNAPASTTFSASEIINILENNPDLLSQVKDQAADYLSQHGMSTTANDVSDQQLFAQIQSSDQLRSALTSFLIARGYALSSSTSTIDSPQTMYRTTQADCNSSQTSLRNNSGMTPSLVGTCGQSSMSTSNSMKRATPQSKNTPPEVLHRPAPYNLRSLRDLYTQLPEPQQELRRFGSELFTEREIITSTRSTDNAVASLDVPLGPDYVLGPGDMLNIDIWGNSSQSVPRTVDREGAIMLPEAGRLQVGGSTVAAAQKAVEAALKSQFRDSHIAVTVSRLHSVRVYLAGDVRRPGGYDIPALATPINALLFAGGPTAVGSLRIVRHMRGRQLLETVDLYDFLLHGVHISSIHFESGDTLLVPPAGEQVAISGAVRRPAIYELLPGQTNLANVIEDAGGPRAVASLDHITVERINDKHERETITVSTDHLDESLRTFVMRDGDRVLVSAILPYSQRIIYLQGHVVRPGRMAFTEGMKLSDVLQSDRDMLPEPAVHGELIRLVPPDLHPEAIDFNVPDVMIGNSNITLEPFDTIHIFGRYEIDAPTVTIQGEVLHPGTYPLSASMTAAGLVRMAGGFNRDAMRSAADLTSYTIENANLVHQDVQSIRIGDAVTGSDPSADAKLKPGDVLSVHQITGWGDIGQSVAMKGQIRFPGNYGFRDGEHLSDVLRRAGGFRDSSYPEGAVLVREQVRELEDKSREELIRQIETTGASARLSPSIAAAGDSGQTLQLIKAQQDDVLNQLKSHPATGRLVIHISPDIDSWANTPADIELRRGDVLTVPKRPGFVLISGQVYNPTALSFTPDKTAAWYLAHAGGTNTTANRKEIFIIRANGSVIGHRSSGFFGSDVLSTKLNPGDVIVVPQKILGNSLLWRNILSTAQLASSIAITASIAAL